MKEVHKSDVTKSIKWVHIVVFSVANFKKGVNQSRLSNFEVLDPSAHLQLKQKVYLAEVFSYF